MSGSCSERRSIPVCGQPSEITHRYFNTSANQKLSVSSIFPVFRLLTSWIPANPVEVLRYVLKLWTALRARFRYSGFPVTRHA